MPMTIVQKSEEWYKGFMVTMTTQVGCATTHDYPSNETVTAVEKNHKEHLSKTQLVVTPAFEHFVNGDHPFTCYLSYLQPDLEIKQDPKFHYIPEDVRRSIELTDPIHFQQYEIFLFLKPKTPRLIAVKIGLDFLLSQLFNDKSRLLTAYDNDTAMSMFDDLSSGIVAGYFGTFQWRFEYYLGYIAKHKDKVEELASSLFTPQQSYGYDWNNKQRIKRFRAKAILKILKEQPYGKELIAEAVEFGNNSQELQYLALMSSDIQAPELPDILKPMSAGLGDYYKDLTTVPIGK
jgi:hypothetical protein